MKKEGRNNEYFNIPKKLILEEGYKMLSSDAKLIVQMKIGDSYTLITNPKVCSKT